MAGFRGTFEVGVLAPILPSLQQARPAVCVAVRLGMGPRPLVQGCITPHPLRAWCRAGRASCGLASSHAGSGDCSRSVSVTMVQE